MIPLSFYLGMGQSEIRSVIRNQTGAIHRCMLRWRSSNRAGAQLLGTMPNLKWHYGSSTVWLNAKNPSQRTESLDEAVALAARIPAARLGGAVEVRPCEVYW